MIAKWTETDLKQLTLDLLYGLKAFKDNNLYDGDFNFGNVLLQLDDARRFIKAGFTDFEEAEVLTEKSKKEFTDPLYPDHFMQSQILDRLAQIYRSKRFEFPEVLKEDSYKSQGSINGFDVFGQTHLEQLKALDKESETYSKDRDKIWESYGKIVHIPTKTLEEMISELESS